MFENILVETADQVTVITINRPQALNALNKKTIAELTAAVEGLTHVAILTGAGEKAFVAGADISEMANMDVAEALKFAQAGHTLMRRIEEARVPVIAAVGGFALGGGCELALACDFIYAGPRASFGQPEVNLGVIPGFGGTYRLSRRVGAAKARELIYSGRRIDAAEALRIGLASAVVEDPVAEARKIAVEIATKGPLAVGAAKRVIDAGTLEAEVHGFADLFKTGDQKEGMKAFLEKRKPKWTSS